LFPSHRGSCWCVIWGFQGGEFSSAWLTTHLNPEDGASRPPKCLPTATLHGTTTQKTTRTYEDVSKSFLTGRLERELRMVKLSASRCSCIAVLWASLVSFAAITLCVASQRVFIAVVVYFVIDSVRKLLDLRKQPLSVTVLCPMTLYKVRWCANGYFRPLFI
jgi:hypothetical protein